MDQEDVRKEAVRRFLGGERSRRICSEFRRSKRWLLKWAQRSKTGGPDWFKGRDKKPERCPHQTDLRMEQQVIEARKKLEVSKYSQVGPLAVAWELHQAGVKAPPPRTISRILRRHGLVHHKQRYVPKGKDYPEIPALTPHEVHQMDIVGPRFISGDGRFYSINVMDVFTGKTALNPSRQRTDADVLRALVATWQRLAIPKYLQMDNQLPLRGSNRYPRSFGLVIRLCLHLGIEPVFIPRGEPWRNGVIERFQDVFDKLFFRTQTFTSLEALGEEAARFEQFHNENHRYSTRDGQAPNERETQPHRLSEGFELPSELYSTLLDFQARIVITRQLRTYCAKTSGSHFCSFWA
jgi:transposase InsO family protein